MLFRFQASQAAELGLVDVGRTRRPRAIKTVESLTACEKWRSQVVKEISRKVARIQEPTLSDHMIRDLNDEINQAMREKHTWEVQIRNLGGPNYSRAAHEYDDHGREIPGAGKGYRYFGRARELPGVKEMIEAATVRPRDKSDARSAAPRVNVDAAYYGYSRDDEDDDLLAYEKQREAEAREALLAEPAQTPEGWEPLPGDAGDAVVWRLPTPAEVQEELVERRRRKLIATLE
jgi:pre-mRNA-splicing factor ISY1